MAISFKDKIAYVNKYAPKDNDKVQKLIKLAVNIDSQKLNLNADQKAKLKDGVEKAFAQIKTKRESSQATPSAPAKKRGRPKGSTKASKAQKSSGALQDFKKKIGRKLYAKATTGTRIDIDMERPAVRPGKRIVRKKGETSNQYGTFSNKVGRKYWENRANRMDINQPSKTRYPKLAKGGTISKGKYRAAYPYVDTMEDFKEENDFSSWESSDQKRFNELVSQKLVRVSGGVFEIKEVNKEQLRDLYNELREMGVNFMDDFDDWKVTFSKYEDGGSIAKGNYEMVLSKAKELHHHASELQDALKKEKNIEAWVVAKVERASQDLSDVTHYLDGMSEYGEGGKLEGNYVAVGEKDGYWTIITKPTTKEKAQQMIDMGSLPKGEVGKVVTVKEAKDHKKVIGREYLAQGGTLAGNLDVDNIGFGIMAKGGKLTRKQRNLDMNNNGKLDKEDFQIIRSGKRIVRKNKK